jgi:hypothetical protein
LGTGTFAPQNSCTFGEHASVFTQGSDLPWNLQALFCFQSTTELFLQRSKKVEMLAARAQAKHAFPHGLKHPGLRRAQAQAPVKTYNTELSHPEKESLVTRVTRRSWWPKNEQLADEKELAKAA